MGKQIVEDCLALDLAWLMRLGPVRDGQAASGDVAWSISGSVIGALRFRLDLRTDKTAQLVLDYTLARANGEREPITQIVSLTSLPQYLGGRRWWMRCPVTGERVRVLYLSPEGERFAGRKALGLTYGVERLGRFDRPFEKRFRAQRRLGGSQGLATGLKRPKGMWRRTYARHAERFEKLEMDCAKRIASLLGTA